MIVILSDNCEIYWEMVISFCRCILLHENGHMQKDLWVFACAVFTGTPAISQGLAKTDYWANLCVTLRVRWC